MATVDKEGIVAITDIVVLTYKRPEIFQRTMDHIRDRTSTPRCIHVLGSNLAGIAEKLRSLPNVTTTDPVVCVDDDILCPKLEPDWLARGLAAMAHRPRLGMLALNNPQANLFSGNRHVIERGPVVTTCRNVGNTFLFIRRELLGRGVPSDVQRHPVKAMCFNAAKLGYEVGYMTQVYCQLIGAISVRRKKIYTADLQTVYPIDSDTLEPPEEYRE